MMNSELPLISCICVTKNRPALLRRAIGCFRRQTYVNKELLIVYDEGDQCTEEVINTISSKNIRYLRVPAGLKMTLGALRNFGIEHAKGELICQWDDDDWYHIGRLEFQQAVIRETGMKGCVLTQWIIYDEKLKKAYFSISRLWEGSLMCDRDTLIKHKYANKKKSEDSDLVTFLFTHHYLFPLDEVPHLYIYTYHGKNTWGRGHFNYYFKLSQEMDSLSSSKISALLEKTNPKRNDSMLLDSLVDINIFD
jgi:glycosyltransferase involved in cell wall biosynthesis